MFINAGVILAVYIVLLIVGGLVGFLKAGSKASLIMSVTFAVMLGVCQFLLPPGANRLADVLLLILLVFFGMRFAKSKKFMPAGLMTIVTVVTLVLRFVLV